MLKRGDIQKLKLSSLSSSSGGEEGGQGLGKMSPVSSPISNFSDSIHRIIQIHKAWLIRYPFLLGS